MWQVKNPVGDYNMDVVVDSREETKNGQKALFQAHRAIGSDFPSPCVAE
jgi:hypothetical protein